MGLVVNPFKPKEFGKGLRYHQRAFQVLLLGCLVAWYLCHYMDLVPTPHGVEVLLGSNANTSLAVSVGKAAENSGVGCLIRAGVPINGVFMNVLIWFCSAHSSLETHTTVSSGKTLGMWNPLTD